MGTKYSYSQQKAYKRLAEPLLAEAFWSEWEYLYSSEVRDGIIVILDSELEAINDKFRHIEDAILKLKSLCSELEISFEQFLPIDLVQEMERDLDAFWEGKLTLMELIQIDEQAASRAVCNMVGMGIFPEQEQHIADLFKQRKVKMSLTQYESPWEKVHELMSAISHKLWLEYLEDFATESVANWTHIYRFNHDLVADIPDSLNWSIFSLENASDSGSDQSINKMIEGQIILILQDVNNPLYPDVFRKMDNGKVFLGFRVFKDESQPEVTQACSFFAKIHRMTAFRISTV